MFCIRVQPWNRGITNYSIPIMIVISSLNGLVKNVKLYQQIYAAVLGLYFYIHRIALLKTGHILCKDKKNIITG